MSEINEQEDINTKTIHIFPNKFNDKVACGKDEKLCSNIISILEYNRNQKNNPNICNDCKKESNWN